MSVATGECLPKANAQTCTILPKPKQSCVQWQCKQNKIIVFPFEVCVLILIEDETDSVERSKNGHNYNLQEKVSNL